ncbi:MAG: hypothetical protein ACKO32_16845 [Planctomycetia bacterium]
MNCKHFLLMGATLAFAGSALAQDATQNNKRGNSLYVFPLIQKTPGSLSLMTITNLDEGGTQGTASVDAHFVFRNGQTCLETLNFSKPLTPLDTLTISVNGQGALPNGFNGFAYVYAEDTGASATPIKYDNLAAAQYVFDGINSSSYEIDAYGFKAGSALANLANTDTDADGVRDLNGTEYESVPNVQIYPRFFGQASQGGPGFNSTLTLLSLVGSQFDVVVDLLIINDNENAFSGQAGFRCHKTFPLMELSGATSNEWLANSSGDNDSEFIVWPRSSPQIETGMLRVVGATANSTAATQDNPALLSLLVNRRPSFGTAPGAESENSGDTTATLPYGKGVNTKGKLVNLSLFPNNN